MGMRITTNVAAINANRNLANTQNAIGKSFAQLASGSRITKAADDAAGLAISDGLQAHIRSTRQANRNANDGISMVQVAEGGLSEVSNIVTRLRELGIQAASDTISDQERSFVDKEVQQLKSEVQRISSVTTWGATRLLDGSTPNFDFQVGIFNDESNDRIQFRASENVSTLDSLGIADISYTSKEGAQDALSRLDDTIVRVNQMRSNFGALQNRLVSTSAALGVSEENMAAANSRIRDTDVATASSELTRNNILLQASTATLAQANQTPNLALKLLG